MRLKKGDTISGVSLMDKNIIPERTVVKGFHVQMYNSNPVICFSIPRPVNKRKTLFLVESDIERETVKFCRILLTEKYKKDEKEDFIY